MQIFLYSIILACSALITALLSLYILRFRTNRASEEFIFLLVAMSWWAAMAALEANARTLDHKILFSIASYPGSQFAPVFYFLFALKYTRMDSWLSARKKALLFILPVFSLLVAATNGAHHLLWSDISLAESAFAGSYAVYTHGPWYWVEVLYSYCLLLAGIGALFLASTRYPLLNSIQCRWILTASLIPLAGNMAYAFFFTSVQGIDPTPLVLSICSILIALGISQLRILDIVPIAREKVLESMKEGVIIIDRKSRIVDINPSAINLLRLPRLMGGKNITDIFPWWSSMHTTLTERTGVIPIPGEDGTTRWITWSASEIPEPDEESGGICLLIQDVTSHYELEERLRAQTINLEELTKELSSAHKSLQLMTSITRHDILNMIAVQRVYMENAFEENTPESYENALKKSYPAAQKIQELITFTHEYQNLGVAHPAWISLSAIVHKVSGLFGEEEVDIISSIPDSIEIYTNPLFEKVFYILFDNAIRHGEHTTRIHISHQVSRDLVIIGEDNGRGIPDTEKEEIFNRGVGNNTGLGLFLAREILQIDTSTIRETGKPGSGARFEITIPRSRWRDTRDTES